MELHKETVDKISTHVKHFHAIKSPFRIYHGSTNSTRPSTRTQSNVIDTSSLNHILSLSTTNKTITMEPNVPMDVLLEYTLKNGLLPPVVMEFPGITCGGGMVGVAGESSSFKHGFFHNTIISIEMVLPNGSIVTASPKSNPDLFHGTKGSLGTLGVLTLLELQLIDAQPFVEMEYHSVPSTASAVETCLSLATKPQTYDYIDGIIFSPTKAVITTARLTNLPPTPSKPLARFLRAQDPWFYMHAQSSLASHKSNLYTVPIADYLFRYDRGAFWMGRHAFSYFRAPFDWFSRWVLNSAMKTRVMYHAMHASGMNELYVIQDVVLPATTAAGFIEWVDERLGIYPLWLCPLPTEPSSAMRARVPGDGGMMLNVGVWGPPAKSKESDILQLNRELEHGVYSRGGLKWPYAQHFYTEEEFWDIYDKPHYEGLREQFGAEGLPSIWDKLKPSPPSTMKSQSRIIPEWLWQVWPIPGLYGVWKAVIMDRGGGYLLGKDSEKDGEKKKE